MSSAARIRLLADQASRHGVLGILRSLLPPRSDLAGTPLAPTGLEAAADALWYEHLMRGMAEVVRLLGRAGIPTCALKGPALAERLYTQPAARLSTDIDLLVHPDDFERAGAALQAAGYATEHGYAADYLRSHSHHLPFVHQNRAPLELHFRAYAGFGTIIPAAPILSRAVPYALRGEDGVLVPCPEDEFLLLAVHAAGHSFVRLIWLYDLKLLLLKHPELDFDRVGAHARSLGVSTVVGYTLHVLRSWMQVRTDAALRVLGPRPARARLADILLRAASTPSHQQTRDNLTGLLFTSLLCDRTSSSAWLLQHHILRATRRRLHRLAPGCLPARWSA